MVGVSLREHKPLEAPSIRLRHLGGEVHVGKTVHPRVEAWVKGYELALKQLENK